MRRALWLQTFWDSAYLLSGCCALLYGFIWLRLWIVSQINFSEAASMFNKIMPDFFQKLLPIPLDVLTTIEGRVVIGYEELPVGLLLALWTVTRGTDCLAGRLGDGTMEMLLAQPIRRRTLVTSHSGITFLGVGLLALCSLLGTATGIATLEFDQPTVASTYLPATANLFSIGILMMGIATLCSALARTRAEAVALFVGFYVLQITFKIVGLMSAKLAWFKNLTFLSAYEPAKLTIGIKNAPEEFWPLFWQYNAILLGIGVGCWIVATLLFCRRDVPAPL